MNERTISVGQTVRLGGRDYTVRREFPIGANVARECPWIESQWGVDGKRGATAMLMVFRREQPSVNKTYRLIFVTRGSHRVEQGVL